MTAPRVLVCGECVVDLVQEERPGGPRTYAAHPGGSPANVAVTLARLGVPTGLLARLARDAFGRLLREHLEASGVDLSLAVDAAEPATLAVASLDADGVATYDFWVTGTADTAWAPGELPDPLPEGVRALHTGSMALELEPGAEQVRALVARAAGRVLVSYDPNVRLARRGDRERALASVEELVALSDVVKASSEDVGWLLPDLPLDAVLERWSALGPALVVVTDGPQGALALGPSGRVDVPAVPVQVVDTVGAGDSFSAALLAGLDDEGLLDRAALRGAGDQQLRRALGLAARVSSATCGRPGADPPRREELAASGSDEGQR